MGASSCAPRRDQIIGVTRDEVHFIDAGYGIIAMPQPGDLRAGNAAPRDAAP